MVYVKPQLAVYARDVVQNLQSLCQALVYVALSMSCLHIQATHAQSYM